MDAAFQACSCSQGIALEQIVRIARVLEIHKDLRGSSFTWVAAFDYLCQIDPRTGSDVTKEVAL